MGIHDREYYQEDQGGFLQPRQSGGGMSITVRLIILNAVIYFGGIFLDDKGLPAQWLGVSENTLTNPLYWYQFLTYGFVHDPTSAMHLLFNMIGLWFFGAPVENRLGRREFLFFYLIAVIFGGLVAGIRHSLMEGPTTVIGASGAITGVILLFAIFYPRAKVLLMFIIPMPAWVLGILLIAQNVFGQISGGDNIAYDVHLAGAAIAAVYYFGGLNFSRFFDRFSSNRVRRGPKLRVHRPKTDGKVAAEADRILEKLHRDGLESLTAKEKRMLEKYSRQVRDDE